MQTISSPHMIHSSLTPPCLNRSRSDSQPIRETPFKSNRWHIRFIHKLTVLRLRQRGIWNINNHFELVRLDFLGISPTRAYSSSSSRTCSWNSNYFTLRMIHQSFGANTPFPAKNLWNPNDGRLTHSNETNFYLANGISHLNGIYLFLCCRLWFRKILTAFGTRKLKQTHF